MNGKFQPVQNIELKIYLDSVTSINLIGKVITNQNGVGYSVIPASLKTIWDGASTHKFFAVSVENKEFAESKSDAEITKAKISLDTVVTDGVRSITAKVFELKDKDWNPVKDVEMKIGVRRLGSSLSVGKEATYTTDSTGQATAEFKRDSLPGENGILTLVVE